MTKKNLEEKIHMIIKKIDPINNSIRHQKDVMGVMKVTEHVFA